MKMTAKAYIEHLGQTGLRIRVDDIEILVDPYLSNSVEELDAPDLARKIPTPYKPEELTNITWILITHDHIDHCDPQTLPIIADVNPKAKFIGPLSVRMALIKWGIHRNRIIAASNNSMKLSKYLEVKAIPAAHPKIQIDKYGQPYNVGYIFKRHDQSLYLAGDTSICEELIKALRRETPISTALLPVNEDNFFRRRRGIIGNMSIREAYLLAEEIGLANVAPVHWDMFEENGVTPEEIISVYRSREWGFKLIKPEEIVL